MVVDLEKPPTKRALSISTIILLSFIFGQIEVGNGAAVVDKDNYATRPADNSFYAYKIDKPQPAAHDRAIKLELAPPTALHAAAMAETKAKSTYQNLTALTWAHAVNSQLLLDEALQSDVDMIEADIVLGQLNGSGDDVPVMAHPPANSSDISLEQFLVQIKSYNAAHGDAMKGVKLDFKSIEVFEGALEILHATVPQMSYPIWLNADIISGPVNQTTTVPVDPARFLAGCAAFEQAVLSIGWTTRWGANYTDQSDRYTANQINEMLEAITGNNVTQPITFPVRAGIAANSIPQLHDLVGAVNETNESTLTIWSSDDDYVDVEKLRELIFSFGFDRVYLDVPDALSAQLDLGTNGGGKTTALPSLLGCSAVIACALLVSFWLDGTGYQV